MRRTAWLIVYACCAAAEMLLEWLKEHAESKIIDKDSEDET